MWSSRELRSKCVFLSVSAHAWLTERSLTTDGEQTPVLAREASAQQPFGLVRLLRLLTLLACFSPLAWALR